MVSPSPVADRRDERSQSRAPAAGSTAAVPSDRSSYPGGKSGSGIWQRLINLIPPHRVLIVPFAGRCGVTRRIRPAEHTILIDQDPNVCQWWDDWRRSPAGRSIEIHNCDSVEWLRYRCGLTEYCAAESHDAGSRDAAVTPDDAAEAFVFCDPPYVLSERSHGRIYAYEMTDADHLRFLEVVTSIPTAEYSLMVCGYACSLYASLDPWRSIDHRVPTRGGLQDERIWLSYPEPKLLHDHRFVGRTRRERERIRRRQKTVTQMLAAMDPRERFAMLESIKENL